MSHLTSLTSQSSHSLLSPLGTHASLNIKKHGDSFVSGNAERTRGERLGAHNESHAFGRNVLDVLDGSLFGRGGEEEGRKGLKWQNLKKIMRLIRNTTKRESRRGKRLIYVL